MNRPELATSVDVVMVSWNAADLLPAALGPLRDHPSIRVLVADNGSEDRSIEVAEELGARVVTIGWNSGFGFACNRAAELGEASIILFLNPDTRVTAADIHRCAERLLDDPSVGILGCKLVQANGELDHACRRAIPRPADALRYFALGASRSNYVVEGNLDEETEVEAVNGAFLMIRRDLFVRVGGFDERYWMYAEDLDLCLLVRNEGAKVLYWPEVVAVHLKGASSGRYRSPRVNWHFHRSMWLFFRKHQASSFGWPMRAFVLVGICCRGIYVTLRDAGARLLSRARRDGTS
jgi:GT2 family glycosyltransferase